MKEMNYIGSIKKSGMALRTQTGCVATGNRNITLAAGESPIQTNRVVVLPSLHRLPSSYTESIFQKTLKQEERDIPGENLDVVSRKGSG